MTRVAVAGGTGEVGARVMARGAARGLDMVNLSRSEGADLMTGVGVAARLAGVDTVIDCVSIETMSGQQAEAFFTATSRHLLEAGEEAGVRHHVTLSIVGVDEVPSGYYRGKVAQERIVTGSDRPWTVLRATQFHEFAAQMVRRTSIGPVAFVPRMLSAPVAADEVADTLLDLALGEPRHEVVEIGGPERLQMVDMVRRLLRTTRRRKLVVPVPMPGAAKQARSGVLCPEAPFRTGVQPYAAWLQEQVSER
ncbi:SDR family oxidoreductase [Nocardioides alcanivorans]|uniref:SDR family oxidoreductase n=1 Tax=Nocardioides alcanivorans TaxID=2897352 RepID=UPI001F3D1F8A|nr:NAD(P)H-binding protein [Nocardioides alcanivorans]